MGSQSGQFTYLIDCPFYSPFFGGFMAPSPYPDRYRMVCRKGFALTHYNPDGFVQVQIEGWFGDRHYFNSEYAETHGGYVMTQGLALAMPFGN